jgi:formamidopyrimidine-DNA glycosylase
VPELPEVHTIAAALDGTVRGREIARALLTAPDLYRRDSRRVTWSQGCVVEGVERVGKAILFRLRAPSSARDGAPRAMVVHLGMTGRFAFHEVPPRRLPPHCHGRWRFRDGTVLHHIDPRRFGYVYLGAMEGLRDALNMGRDPFELRSRDLARILAGRRAPVKALLLNQRLVAGMGNIYVDEALFLAGVHPLTPGEAAAAHAAPILQASRRVLRRAIRSGGTTLRDYRRLDGDTGNFQVRLRVYGRDGEPCRRCNTPIEKLVVAGRGTHVCPRCQRQR